MKKILIIASLAVLLGAAPIRAAMLAPDGTLAEYLGPSMFHSYSIQVEQADHNLIVTIETNYPGPYGQIDYNIADLLIRTKDHVYAVKLCEPRRGTILADPQWTTSELFVGIGVDYGRTPEGNFIPVKARGGEVIGKADVTWLTQPDGRFRITVKLPAALLEKDEISGSIEFVWSTAYCANSLVTTVFDSPPGPTVPMDGPPYTMVFPPSEGETVPPQYFFGGGFGWGWFGGGLIGWGILPGGYWPVPVPPVPPVPLAESIFLFCSGVIALLIRRERVGKKGDHE